MSNEYFSRLEEDTELYVLVQDRLPQLQRLRAAQIEKLVFYLKSLHNYYPKSENLTTFCSEFEAKLEELRNDPEQIDLQRQAGAKCLKAIAFCVFAGLVLAGALLALLAGQMSVAIGAFLVSGACILFADSKLLRLAMVLCKEQDRKYFLASLRAARACNELDWAGLFAYNQALKIGPQSDADLARVGAEVSLLVAGLRAALYNDEYFQDSQLELRSTERHDA